MFNKDKRSLVLAMALGDGCLHATSNGASGAITIDHGLEQADYQAWKAQMLSVIFERNVRVRTGHKGKSVQVSVAAKRLRSWRKFCYPNGKKDLARILPFIRHPEMATAIWLMDDGYVEPSKDKRYPDALYGAILRVFTCDQSLETQQVVINWFNSNFGVTAKVLFMHDKRTNKTYPFIKFNQKDSLVIWSKIREFVLTIKSMQHKFRYIERIYQLRCVQLPLTAKRGE